VAAMNAVDAPLPVTELAAQAIVCDLSVPASLPGEAAGRRPDVRFIRGGMAALPFGEDLEILNYPLPVGQVYGCMAEAMLLGWEGVRDTAFTGPLSPAHVARVAAMAARHGLELADYRSPGGWGAERKEAAYVSAH
jgi:predicted amino acid dehydrogenase